MLFVLLGAVLASGFSDPAPPRAVAETAAAVTVAKAQPGLKFFARPKPLAAGAVVQDWASFLGPSHNAVSGERPLLASFSSPPRVVWEVARGEGYAAPSVVGGRVLLFHRVGDEEVLECLEAETGKRFWRRADRVVYEDRYGFSRGPRCQPVSNGRVVITLGVAGRLTCTGLMSGQMLWQRSLLDEFKVPQNFFGVGGTALIEGGLVVVGLGAAKGPTLAAFDLVSGRLRWGAGREWSNGYASPVPATFYGKRKILFFTGGDSQPPDGGLMCVDALTGRVDFTWPWRSRRYESVNASSPVVIQNRIFISECYGRGGLMLEVGADFKPREVWQSRDLGTHFMTAVYKDGHLYGIDGHGPQNAPLVCIDAETGKQKWRTEPEWEETARLPEGERRLRLSPALGSLLLVDGRALLQSEYGHLVWLDLNPKGYRELSRTRLFLSRESWSMPSLSRGLLYVSQNNRGYDGTAARLLCVDVRGAP